MLLQMKGAQIVIYYYSILLRCTLHLFLNWRELIFFNARVEVCYSCTIGTCCLANIVIGYPQLVSGALDIPIMYI